MADQFNGTIPSSSPDIPGASSARFPPTGNIKSYGDFSSPGAVSARDLGGRFTKGGFGFVWTGIEGVMNLPGNFSAYLDDEIKKNLEDLRASMESYAQANAPWNDQTGNARAGLKAIADSNTSTGKYRVTLGHSVSYGYFLEFANGGQYAIIYPTVRHFAGQVDKLIDPGAGFE